MRDKLTMILVALALSLPATADVGTWTALPLGSTAEGAGAALVAVETGGPFTATTVQGVLEELEAATGSSLPAPVFLGFWANEFNFEQAATESVQYSTATYQWTTDNHSTCFGWPRARLWAAWAHGWHIEMIIAFATATNSTAVAFDCKNRAGTDYCTEWTSSTWTGGGTIEQRVVTLTGDLPTVDDILCVAFHSDGTNYARLHMASIFAYPIPAP